MSEKFKVILDPMLLEPSKINEDIDEFSTLEYLSNLIDFLSENLDVEFDSYEGAFYVSNDQSSPPFLNYTYPILGDIFAINAKIFKMISNDYVILSPNDNLKFNTKLNEISNSENHDCFLMYLNYLIRVHKPFYLFMGEINHKIYKPIQLNVNKEPFYILQIDNPKTDCGTDLYKSLKFNAELNNEFFPNVSACIELNSEFNYEKSKASIQEQDSVIEKYGKETALRNGYIEDNKLSEINSRKSHSKRSVFKRQYRNNKYYYLSIDYESGGLEVFDNTPTHQGQYNFSCGLSKNAKPQNHILYLR